MSATPPYLDDIRSQPAALQELLDVGLPADVRRLVSDLGRFDRIVLTGMGASLFANYPAFLQLGGAGLPVWCVETSELLGPAGGLITSRSLLWVVSQSGNSAEVTALLERLRMPRPVVLGVTNDTASGLGLGADVLIELHSGEEHTVGTRSYVNTLAAMALATSVAVGGGRPAELFEFPERLESYLAGWDDHVSVLARAVRRPTIFVVGRGASLAAVETGALIIKEAAKVPVEGMSAPQFRHGPLELVGPDVTVIHLAGHGPDIDFNRQMVADVEQAEGAAVWLGTGPDEGEVTLPSVSTVAALPIAEILPLQLLSVVLAERNGVEPGAFRTIEKVTRTL